MAERIVRNENFINIQGWMLNELGLKGNELLIYAIIYGFSQTEGSQFAGSLRYLAEWTNSTKQTVQNTLKSLSEKQLIQKQERYENNVKFVSYYAKNLHGGIQKICTGYTKNLHGGIQKICTNNIEPYNLEDTIAYNQELGEVSPSPLPGNSVPKDIQDVVNAYHEICTSFPKLRTINEKRQKAIKARLKTHSLADMKEAFTKAQASSFLKGKNNRNWTADFDFMMRADKLDLILEGRYDNKSPNPQGGEQSGYDTKYGECI